LHALLSYVRTSLVISTDGEMLTIDVVMLYSNSSSKVQRPDMVVVETKTGNGRGVSDQALSDLGIRPVSMSKYCLGVAALNPKLPANKWSRLMKRHQWARVP